MNGPAPEKADLILTAAMDMFLRYGFSRTTMEDIAREAGLSRPALYQHFSNKAAIYQALTRLFCKKSLAAAQKAADEQSELSLGIMTIVDAGLLSFMEEIQAAPHGDEFLAQKSGLTEDMLADWRIQMEQILAGFISRQGNANKALTPMQMAMLILDVIYGVKQRNPKVDVIRAHVTDMAKMVAHFAAMIK